MGFEGCDYVSLVTVAFGLLLAISEYLGYTDKTEAASISEIVINSAKSLASPRNAPAPALTAPTSSVTERDSSVRARSRGAQESGTTPSINVNETPSAGGDDDDDKHGDRND